MRFQYTINHVPGKTLYTADALSRTPLQETSDTGDCTSTNEIEQFVQVVTAALPANQDRLDSYRKAQAEDSICSKLIEYYISGWPVRNKLSRDLKDYGDFVTLGGTLLLYQSRIVVPASMRQITLEKIYQGHQGTQQCRMCFLFSLVAREMENFVQSCPVCQKTTPPTREPLITTPLPSYPWERIAGDLIELKGSVYQLVVDYYSRSVEVQKLNSTISTSVITLEIFVWEIWYPSRIYN